MKEWEYIVATNRCKLQIAETVLRDFLPRTETGKTIHKRIIEDILMLIVITEPKLESEYSDQKTKGPKD